MNQSDEVLYHLEGSVATITLNRPESLNAMTPKLMGGLVSTLERVRADDTVRVLVLTGAGRGFCAGADLAAVADPSQAEAEKRSSEDTEASQDGGDLYNQALQALHECPVPTLARVHGPAAGGGFGLALACDITIAAKSAFFVATFVPNLGIVPDMGTTWQLPRRVGRARTLGLTLLGDRLPADQAESWGLIWRCVDDEELDEIIASTAGSLARLSPSAATRLRQTVDHANHSSFSDQLELEMHHQRVLIPRNMEAGARAFLAKETPSFDGRRD